MSVIPATFSGQEGQSEQKVCETPPVQPIKSWAWYCVIPITQEARVAELWSRPSQAEISETLLEK
jgi:hypothetical protein